MGKLTLRSVGVLAASRSVGVPPTRLLPSQIPSIATTMPRFQTSRFWVLLLHGILLTSSVFAQSEPSSNTNIPAPKAQPPQKGKALAPATPSAPSVTPPAKSSTPSRYVGNDLKAYVEAHANQLAMHERTSDPFGQLQDPNAKPVAKPTVTKTLRRPIVEPPASLTDIVARIEITTIMPKDKRFLVGSRSIGQGDKLPLSYHNKQIHTQVIEVSSRKIVFRNLDTGELGVRQLNILPLGMTPGTRNITAPGMVPVNPNSPLEIDAPSLLPAAVASP